MTPQPSTSQGVSITLKPLQDNGGPKRKCSDTLDTFGIKRPKVVDAPVKDYTQVVKSNFGDYVTKFAPSIAEPKVINFTREDTGPVSLITSDAEQSLFNLDSGYIQAGKSKYSNYVFTLSLSKLETLYEFYPTINVDKLIPSQVITLEPNQILPPIIHLDDKARVVPISES